MALVRLPVEVSLLSDVILLSSLFPSNLYKTLRDSFRGLTACFQLAHPGHRVESD